MSFFILLFSPDFSRIANEARCGNATAEVFHIVFSCSMRPIRNALDEHSPFSQRRWALDLSDKAGSPYIPLQNGAFHSLNRSLVIFFDST